MFDSVSSPHSWQSPEAPLDHPRREEVSLITCGEAKGGERYVNFKEDAIKVFLTTEMSASHRLLAPEDALPRVAVSELGRIYQY